MISHGKNIKILSGNSHPALAIARARQQNKRDWANRHKLKEK